MQMEQGTTSTDAVRRFFAAFAAGDLERVVDAFHHRAEIVAVREGARAAGELHGTYRGRPGAREFVNALGRLLDTQAFDVDEVIGAGHVAYASGTFHHRVRSTGKSFTSRWALRCELEDGLLRSYRFFEDSAAYADASR
ncbi:MAG TPA: nuclear transport factor 2 family protein [Anaeromyxobacter sp.]|nr:nuclear transport factor 2 family protein [Anaeromyxobacter sp.]